jgi:RNA polymerase sigma-70 factor (ECF subfamily)
MMGRDGPVMADPLPGSLSASSRSLGGGETQSSFELLVRAQDGDEAARNELCARYLPRLRRWAHGRLPIWAREHLDTEDIVQDTLLRSVRQLDGFTPSHERAFCAYVCEALRNRLRDALRRAARRPVNGALPDDEPASDPSPLELAVGRQTLAQYEGALERLRESDRELIVARVELGLDYREIAELLDRPSVGAVRVAISRALLRLALEMGLERSA